MDTTGLSCEVLSKVLSLAAAHGVVLPALQDEVVAWLDCTNRRDVHSSGRPLASPLALVFMCSLSNLTTIVRIRR